MKMAGIAQNNCRLGHPRTQRTSLPLIKDRPIPALRGGRGQ